MISAFSAGSSNGGVDRSVESATNVTYVLWFNETGLPFGLKWNITITDPPPPVTHHSTNNTNWFSVPNGTYRYKVDNATGYAPKAPTGVTVVSGNNTKVAIKFDAIPPPPSGSSNPWTSKWVIIGVAVLIAGLVAVVGILLWRQRKNAKQPPSPPPAWSEMPTPPPEVPGASTPTPAPPNTGTSVGGASPPTAESPTGPGR